MPSPLDPLEEAERAIHTVHQATHKQIRPVHKKYPLLFLFLVTFSVAAVFHGLDKFMDQFAFFDVYPLLLVLFGVVGLFITGSLYKRLGKDKYE